MRKKLLAMLAVSAFALGSASAFADLGEDMDTLAENLQVVQKTSDAGELKAALNKMRIAAVDAQKAVSYTHLRAHETRHDLVCRLLLEKKKKKEYM